MTTPLQRHRVIEYAATGNNAVRHWRELKNIAGPLYMTKPANDKWGYWCYDLYLIYPDVPDGAMYGHHLLRPESCTREELLAELEKNRLDTPEHYTAYLDRMMQKNEFIGNVPIAFVRQWDPERADIYARYLEEYYARQREKYLRLEQEREEQRKAEQAKREAEEQAARAEYLGWADSMTAMQFGRISAVLEKEVPV